ncbi:hypothetical protein AX17_006660 [Amanita inopinata Kibby_2008]|nr:hypothetical protein AX17_006660 [Amanita inopinata Kibby_2008]
MPLNGWHRGERTIRSRIGLDNVPEIANYYIYIKNEMTDQHREFHTTRLPFIPVTVLDALQRPWGSILAGAGGKIGFVESPTAASLLVKSKLWPGDPLWEYIRPEKVAGSHSVAVGGDPLVAGIGVELSTRRRNKFAGKIAKFERAADDRESGAVYLDLAINQALGNCPKYIPVRSIYPYPNASPKVAYNKPDNLTPEDRLPEEVISFVQSADIVFFGTMYAAESDEAEMFPSHLGMNYKAGRPGFARVLPSNGRTVVLPDYSGNRFMTSLGNVEATPRASLTILSYVDGHVLYLTGIAKNLLGPDAHAIMPLQGRLTTVYITGYVFVKSALPFRSFDASTTDVTKDQFVEDVQRSPYSPPIRYLAEESARAPSLLTTSPSSVDQLPKATLTSIHVHSLSESSEPGPNDIATFTFQLNESAVINDEGEKTQVKIRPGQAVVLSLTPFFGEKKYVHMFPDRPSEVNDDRVRSWSVVSCSQWRASSSIKPTSTSNFEFSLTMRVKPSGYATTALFTLIRETKDNRPESLDKPGGVGDLGIEVGVVGVSGGFEDVNGDTVAGVGKGASREGMTCIAGGIGITPFLGMMHAMVNHPETIPMQGLDVHLVLSTREPGVLLPLIARALTKPDNDNNGESRKINLRLDVFSHASIPDFALLPSNRGSVDVSVKLSKHSGRVTKDFFTSLLESEPVSGTATENDGEGYYWTGRDVYLCGPDEFATAVTSWLPVDVRKRVKQEGFEY